MPNARHFGWSESNCSLLALPRPSSCPCIGCFVQLRAGSWDRTPVPLSDTQSRIVLDGPLAPGDVGLVIDDVANGEAPFLVQELLSGRLWWYPEAALQPVPADSAPQEVQHPATPGEGSYVTLAADYKTCTDAGRGPLSLLRTEEAYGVVLMESGNRFRVRCCYGDSGDWWYDHGAVRPIHMKYVPESLRAAVRPRWGDYVALTHEHGAFGTAADGPLEPGNLGVVVAVHDLPDSKGGLVRPRYTVRACHNGQACRYQEGAIHLVTPQLLHSPKIAPATAKGRARRLSCSISITEAVTGDAVPCGQMMSRGQLQQVQQVVPGRRYWVAVQMACKDGDLMLANLKPSSFDMYAPTGVPGQYVHLQPVPCKQQQQQQHQQRGQVWQQQGPELVSLSFCNGAAGAAAAGSNVWYNAIDDEAFCVFEWDTSETPLPLKADRMASVDFVWAVCFKDVPGQAKQQHNLLLQTVAANSACTSPIAPTTPTTASAGYSTITTQDHQAQHSSLGVAVEVPAAAPAVFEWLDDICTTPMPARHSRRSCDDSSCSSSDDDYDEGSSSEEDSEADSEASSECSSSSETNGEVEETAVDTSVGNRGRRGSRRDGDGSGAAAGSNGAAGGNNAAGRGSSSGSNSDDSGAAAPATPPASVSPDVPGAAGVASSGADDSESAASRPSSTSSSSSRVGQVDAATAGPAGQAVAANTGRSNSSSSSDGLQDHSRAPSLPSITITPPSASATSSQAPSAAAGSTAVSSSRSSIRSSSSGAVTRSNSLTARAAASTSAGSSAAASRAGHGRRSSAATAGNGSLPNIQEIMRQFEVQAESHQPFWQPGTELAAELASKAMAAAEEWQQDWCRPRE